MSRFNADARDWIVGIALYLSIVLGALALHAIQS